MSSGWKRSTNRSGRGGEEAEGLEGGKTARESDLRRMYVIAVYDVASERTQKMLKIGRRYLTWVQNSVLEGELTALQLDDMTEEMIGVMDTDTDSLILFKNRDERWLEKDVIGVERGSTDQFV